MAGGNGRWAGDASGCGAGPGWLAVSEDSVAPGSVGALGDEGGSSSTAASDPRSWRGNPRWRARFCRRATSAAEASGGLAASAASEGGRCAASVIHVGRLAISSAVKARAAASTFWRRSRRRGATRTSFGWTPPVEGGCGSAASAGGSACVAERPGLGAGWLGSGATVAARVGLSSGRAGSASSAGMANSTSDCGGSDASVVTARTRASASASGDGLAIGEGATAGGNSVPGSTDTLGRRVGSTADSGKAEAGMSLPVGVADAVESGCCSGVCV